MPSKTLRKFSWGAIALLSAGSLSVTPAFAQNTRALTELIEDPALIRGCRQLNQATEVFDNSTLGPIATRIGTLQAGTQVSLTGARSPGRAQVFSRSGTLSAVQPVGWIDASVLTTCGGTPPPTRVCFKANFELRVRSGPTTTASQFSGYNPGNTVVASTNPPTQQTSSNDGRVWMQVTLSDGRTGWIARTGPSGQGSNVTQITCP